MEIFEAKILLKNLLKRIKQVDNDAYQLNGHLTDDELTALRFAVAWLDSSPTPTALDRISPEENVQALASVTTTPAIPTSVSEIISTIPKIKLDLSTLALPPPPSDRRLCLDFGTAMSKVTLVRDETDERSYEDIEILKLGVPGDQEEISESMLVSSVLIDSEGILWFGQMAVHRSELEAQNGGPQRLDNIKRYLSEEGMGSEVSNTFNKTQYRITYGDMVLAYLTFLTWTVNRCVEAINEPRNLNRRFAMPCFELMKSRQVSTSLTTMLFQAQILADTFFDELQDGLPLAAFIQALEELKGIKLSHDFVKEDITEPLGVAGAMMSWEEDVDSLIMVVDIGAGTSDFSMYRMRYDESTGKSTALEVAGSSEGITEAGNHLDKLLKGLILREAGVDSTHPHWVNIQGNLELDLRQYKESLFSYNEISVRLFNDQIINIQLEQFLELSQVQQFAESLINCRDRILNRIDSSFILGAPNRAVGLALTGGGASLPMAKTLAQGTITVQNTEIRLAPTKPFPKWLENSYPELEGDYSRIAVSLGGARKRVILRGGVATITAGDIKSTPVITNTFV